MKKSKSIIYTGIISLILITIGISYLSYDRNAIFKWKDPTAEIRNIGLILIAIGGIPFLILGHINRRNDLEEKRNDLSYRSDVKTLEIILDQVKETKNDLEQILSNEVQIKGVEEFGNGYDLFDIYLEFSSLEKNPVNIKYFFESNYKNWVEINRISNTVVNFFRVTENIRNEQLKSIVVTQLLSSFNEKQLAIIFFSSIIFDCNNKSQYSGNSKILKMHLSDIEYQGFLSLSFYKLIESLNKTYFNFGSQFNK